MSDLTTREAAAVLLALGAARRTRGFRKLLSERGRRFELDLACAGLRLCDLVDRDVLDGSRSLEIAAVRAELDQIAMDVEKAEAEERL